MKRQITSKTSIVLEPLVAPRALRHPLFAINWFNTRLMWLYTLYNHLATVPLLRTGARVFLKARLREIVQGNEADGRELLLVVKYPSGERFLDLLVNRFFQLISLLRMMSVKDFSFVLHKRLDGSDFLPPLRQRQDTAKAYAVHHFSSPTPFKEGLLTISALIADHGVSLRFGSEKAAAVATENNQGQRNEMPFITHTLVIFEAGSYHELKTFLTGRSYQKFCAGLDASFIGMLDRIV